MRDLGDGGARFLRRFLKEKEKERKGKCDTCCLHLPQNPVTAEQRTKLEEKRQRKKQAAQEKRRAKRKAKLETLSEEAIAKRKQRFQLKKQRRLERKATAQKETGQSASAEDAVVHPNNGEAKLNANSARADHVDASAKVHKDRKRRPGGASFAEKTSKRKSGDKNRKVS